MKSRFDWLSISHRDIWNRGLSENAIQFKKKLEISKYFKASYHISLSREHPNSMVPTHSNTLGKPHTMDW